MSMCFSVGVLGVSMNGMWLHSHVTTLTNIYLGMLSLQVQNFI